MTELTTPPPVTDAASTQSVVRAPAVITEQEVLFATAAVVTPAKPPRFGGALHAAAGAMRVAFAWVHLPERPKRYPRHHEWLESASMAREMRRL